MITLPENILNNLDATKYSPMIKHTEELMQQIVSSGFELVDFVNVSHYVDGKLGFSLDFKKPNAETILRVSIKDRRDQDRYWVNSNPESEFASNFEEIPVYIFKLMV